MPMVVGRLHYLWWWALKYAEDGDLTRYDAADIADGAGFVGEATEFLSALVQAGFIDEEGDVVVLHDWDDYAGRLIEQRKLNAGRKKRSRDLYEDQSLTRTVRERDGNRCRYCGNPVNWKDRKGSGGGTYDHVDPEGTNSVENIVVACRGCNSGKGRRTPEEANMILLKPIKKKVEKSNRNLTGIKPESNLLQTCFKPDTAITVPDLTVPDLTLPNQTVPKEEEIASLEITVTRAEVATAEESPEEQKDSSSFGYDENVALIAKTFSSEGYGQATETIRTQLSTMLDDCVEPWRQLDRKESCSQR